MVALAFTIICAVCVFSPPSKFDFQGTTCPSACPSTDTRPGPRPSESDHLRLPLQRALPGERTCANTPMSRALAERQAGQNYPTYAVTYNSPPSGLMVGRDCGSSSR